jgi:aqualysin 1
VIHLDSNNISISSVDRVMKRRGYMNKLFRLVSMLVALVMVLGVFASPMTGSSQVDAQKEVPTFVVAPTEVPTQEPVVDPTEPPVDEPTPLPGTDGEVPVEEMTQVPTESPEVVPLIEAAADVAVPGRYIIVFKDGVDKEAARQAAIQKIATSGGRVAFQYDSALDGIAAEISPDVLRKLRQDSRIEFIEQDQKVHVEDGGDPFSIQTVDNSPDSWGLDRIDQDSSILDGNFYYPSFAGEGVNIYIIDTGIRNTHENFSGRVTLDFDAFNGSTPYGYDCDGHGTHVAGTAAGINTGVARKANIHSVRVLDCGGWGFTSQIVAGINWVAAHHVKPAVANMSLGGWKSPAEDAAVSKAIAKGVTFVVAAGNNGDNACNYSPAHVSGAITVGATDNTDSRAGFSNFGTCVDIFAPGVNITSSIMESDSSYEGGWDGTSMAAPHVTGVAALYLAANPTAKPKDVTKYILDNALLNTVSDPAGSPNRLLHIRNVTPISGLTLVSPLNKVILTDKTPTFIWKPFTDANSYTLHIYDGAWNPLFDFEDIEDTQYTSSELLDGTYNWAVSAKDAIHPYTTFSQPRFFTVDTTGPAAPVQSLPSASATVNGVPTFTWLPSPGAKTYRMAYDQDNSADEPFDQEFLPTTKTQYKPVTMQDNTWVYWYVQAIDAYGNPGPWSPSRIVWINPLTPAAPKLLSPANNSGTSDTTPDFYWSGVTYGSFYHIQVSTNTTFTNIVEEDEVIIAGVAHTFSSTLPEGKYYWRVQAKNNLSEYGPWSAYRSFFVDLTPPAAPVLKTPLSSIGVIGTPTFTWTAPAGAKSYIFQYSTAILFDAGIVEYTNITKPSFKPPVPIPPSSPATFWRVKALDAYGNESEWSSQYMIFIAPAVPAKPTLVQPLAKDYVNMDDVTFDWLPVDYAVEYDLQVCYLTDCTYPAYQNTTADTQLLNINLTPYLYNGNYSWRVRGTNSDAIDGQWSTLRPLIISYRHDFGFSTYIDDLAYWEWIGGGWFINTTDGYIYNDGTVNSEATKNIWKRTNIFNDFSAETRLKMDPGTNGSTGGFYGMAVRASGGINDWGDWNKGYYFGISQENGDSMGCFRIYSLKGTSWTLITGFCDPIIVGNDWNTLRVSAKGKNFKFYINDLLVWQGTDSSYASGSVGTFNYSYMTNYVSGTPGRFYVDYFNFGAPTDFTIYSTEAKNPDPSLGTGIDPYFEKNK